MSNNPDLDKLGASSPQFIPPFLSTPTVRREAPGEIAEVFSDRFLAGEKFATIVKARTIASEVLGQSVLPGTALAKLVDESVERALVRAARTIARSDNSLQQIYDRLVQLYQNQPVLGTRSSNSIARQAYSTPIPIAYLAAQLAGIDENTTVYEPSAGNGSLLITASPSLAIANEIDRQRAANLIEQGYAVTEQDATSYQPPGQVDVVIANPPFGSVRLENGSTKVFVIPTSGIDNRPFTSTQIDFAIALNSLKALKPDGRAVLILGGKLGDERSRSQAYNSKTSRAFYYTLYHHYNVTCHVSIDGNLYSRQGASFPIDLILIEGRGKSQLSLPAARVPQIYQTFTELKELLAYAPLFQQQQSLDTHVNRINSGSVNSSLSTAKPNGNKQFQRISRFINNASGLDDPTTEGSKRSADNDRKLRESGRNGLSSASSITVTRRAIAVGERFNQRQSTFSREARLRLRNSISSSSDGGSTSLNRDRADESRRMVADDGLGTPIGLASTSKQEIEVMNRVNSDEQNIEQPKQVPYIPLSRAPYANTLVPVNMLAGTANALRRLERSVGSLDEYVAERLNYGSPERLHQYFNAEQVDAIALTISNLERGRGFIIGDQTGVGKGRVVAATIRYARETGRIPLFITKDPVLYADMMRDLGDIDVGAFRPFATNANLNIPLADGRRLRNSPTTHQQEMQTFTANGNVGDYSAVFTTYSQLQSVKGDETFRRHFLRAIAPSSIVILDESHEAGGDKNKKLDPDGVANRAQFVRELLGLSQGGFYSSATFAKRPDVMDLYFLTDMGQAVSADKLVGIVESGGIPMQQGLASMLTEAGQYVRRERSYEGVSFDALVAEVDKETAQSVSAIMAAILEFDRVKQQVVKNLDKDLKAEAKSLSFDNSVGGAAAESTNFTSIMHNLIEQSLLALKAETTVQEALTALRRGEKPVIALASTMGSFIGEYALVHQLQPGDPLNLGFQDLLKRYLERTRDILVKDYTGTSSRHRLTDEQLGAEGVAQYEEAIAQIEDTDLSGIPISPIDYIKTQLTQAGYRVSEITGRTAIVDYDTIKNATYSQRVPSQAANRNNIEAFNAGQVDVLILNRSGATGISLHASFGFADRRQRHMIVVQPERDINQFMQMLGRIHRTGQVVLPKFTLLMADLPAEKRPNAVLLKKMASLNANTTAARKSGINLDNVPDFLNDYGDQIVAEIIANNPKLNYKLDFPLWKNGEEFSTENAIARVTGRIALLPLTEQEAFYNQLEREYQELVERQEAMGESILEANSLDLDARTTARMEVIPADPGSDSPFTSAVYLEVVDARTPRKPLTTLEVANVCLSNLSLTPIAEVTDYEFEKIAREARASVALEVNTLRHRVDEYRGTATARMSGAATQKFNQKLDAQLDRVRDVLQNYPVGERVRIVTSNQNVFYGVVGRVWQANTASDNPVVPAHWKMQLLLADQARELTLPLSRVNAAKENSIDIMPQARDMLTGENVYDLFDLRQIQHRQERQIFTGNILRAYEAFQGKLINFTDERGKIRQGILTPQGFNIEKTIEAEPVRLPTLADVKKFITEITQRTGSVQSLDRLLTIKAERRGDGFVLQTPLAKDLGGQYYLDPDILAATGSEFFSVGDRMECSIPPSRLDRVLEIITKEKGLTLAAFDQRTKAREMLGIELPKLQSKEASEPIFTEAIVDVVNSEAKVPSEITVTSSDGGEQNLLDKVGNNGIGQIAVIQAQTGTAEKNIAQLLQAAGLAEAILQGEDFYLKVENELYVPLSIERHGNEIYLTHFLQDSLGELYIDSEMVFNVCGGQLTLTQTAVHNPLNGGEARSLDREFGNIFSKNLLDQGFAAAALSAFQTARPEAYPQQILEAGESQQATEDSCASDQVETKQPIASAASTVPSNTKNSNALASQSIVSSITKTELKSQTEDFNQLNLFADSLNLPNNLKTVSQSESQKILSNTKNSQKLELNSIITSKTQQQPTSQSSTSKLQTAESSSHITSENQQQAISENTGDRLISPVQVFQQVVDRIDPQTGSYLATTEHLSPSLDTLRCWYKAARELGKNAAYLNRITQVANEFKEGTPLSEQAMAAMQVDLNSRTQHLKIIESLERLSDRDLIQQKQSVLQYFNNAPPRPPSEAERAIALSEIEGLNTQIYKLGEMYEKQKDKLESIKKQILYTRNPEYKKILKNSQIILNKISGSIALKEEKEAQLGVWLSQAKEYEKWEREPHTARMRDLAKVLKLPQMQQKLASIQQHIQPSGESSRRCRLSGQRGLPKRQDPLSGFK